MKKSNASILVRLSFVFFGITLLCNPTIHAQCSSIPVSLQQRVEKASHIILGKLSAQHCYDDADGNIYTLNIMDVQAYLKNNTGQKQVAIITLGGVLDDQAQIVYPHLRIAPENEYILFLEGENFVMDDKRFRTNYPDIIQSLPYAEAQGALTYQFGLYHDLHVKPAKNEATTFAGIETWTHEPVQTPEGDIFQPRTYINSQPEFFPITTFMPSPTNGGTIVPGEFINISGSGFGAVGGTVFYTNADDGGATFTASGVASDNVAWTDTDITNKVPSNAGAGPINVNGAFTSSDSLLVNYGHIPIVSNFFGWGVSTRQRFYLVNKNGTGGYTFLYNTTSGFSTNTAAVASFQRALESWRCATYINWTAGGTTAAVAAQDGVSVVTFSSSLPTGILARATNSFQGTANGACVQANTVWYMNGVDLEFRANPPEVGFNWEYGPANPASNEFDFESVAVHELGHGHGLSHRIAPGEVMYFSISNGSSKRSPSGNEIDGGLAKMAYSTLPFCLTPSGVTGPMIALNSGNCVLPIELLSFDARLRGKFVDLSWITHSETNNDFFSVERSTDGLRFESIGKEKGAGTTHEARQYGFTDEQPSSGINYYRLKQTDFDGQYTYSNVLSIQLKTGDFYINILQNPVLDNTLQLVFEAPESGLAAVEMYNAAGQKAGGEMLEISPGTNFPVIDIADFTAGVYFAKIRCGGKTVVIKFIK